MAEELATGGEEIIEAGPVRPLPERRSPGSVAIWGRQVGPVAIAAGAGAAAGIAAVAVAARGSSLRRRPPPRGLLRRRERIVARRSFLVDVHVLGR